MSEVNIRKHAVGGSVYKGITEEEKNNTSKETVQNAPNTNAANPTAPTVTSTTKPIVEVKTATSTPTTANPNAPTSTTVATPGSPTAPASTNPATSSTATTEVKKEVIPGSGRKYVMTINGEDHEIDEYTLDSYFADYIKSTNGVLGKAESEMYNDYNRYKEKFLGGQHKYQVTVGQDGATRILSAADASNAERGLNDKGKIGGRNFFTGYNGERGLAGRSAILNDFMGGTASVILNNKRKQTEEANAKAEAEFKKKQDEETAHRNNLLQGKTNHLQFKNFFGLGGNGEMEELNIRYNQLDDAGRSLAEKTFIKNIKNATTAGDYDDAELEKLLENMPQLAGKTGKEALSYIRGLNLDDPNLKIDDVFNNLGYGNDLYNLRNKSTYDQYLRGIEASEKQHRDYMAGGQPTAPVNPDGSESTYSGTPEVGANVAAPAANSIESVLNPKTNSNVRYYNLPDQEVLFLGKKQKIRDIYKQYGSLNSSNADPAIKAEFAKLQRYVNGIMNEGHGIFNSGGKGFVTNMDNIWRETSKNINPYYKFGRNHEAIKSMTGYTDLTKTFSGLQGSNMKGIHLMMERHKGDGFEAEYRPTMLLKNSKGELKRVTGRLEKGLNGTYNFVSPVLKFPLGVMDETALGPDASKNYSYDNNYSYSNVQSAKSYKDGGNIVKAQQGGSSSGWDLSPTDTNLAYTRPVPGADKSGMASSLRVANTWNDDYKMTDADIAEIASFGLDLASIPVSAIPGAGVATGILGGVGSISNAYAKAKRGEDWGWDLAGDLTLDAATALPFLGAAGKAGKVIKNAGKTGVLVRRALRIMQAAGILGAGVNVVKDWDDIMAGNINMNNIRNISQALQNTHALKRLSFDTKLATKSAGSTHNASVKVNGTKQKVQLTQNQLADLEGKTATEQADYIKNAFIKVNPNVKSEDVNVDMDMVKKINWSKSFFKGDFRKDQATGATIESTTNPRVLRTDSNNWFVRRAVNRALVDNPSLGRARNDGIFGAELEGKRTVKGFYKVNDDVVAKNDKFDALTDAGNYYKGKAQASGEGKPNLQADKANLGKAKEAVADEAVKKAYRDKLTNENKQKFDSFFDKDLRDKNRAARQEAIKKGKAENTETVNTNKRQERDELFKAYDKQQLKNKVVSKEEAVTKAVANVKAEKPKAAFETRGELATKAQTLLTNIQTNIANKAKLDIPVKAPAKIDNVKAEAATKRIQRRKAASKEKKQESKNPRKRVERNKEGGILYAKGGGYLATEEPGKDLKLKFNKVDLSELFRASANAANAKGMDVRQEVPILSTPTAVMPTVKGNMLSRVAYDDAANRYESAARTPITSDGILSTVSRLSANARSNDMRTQGALVNAQSVAQQEVALQQAEAQNAGMRSEIANQNIARLAAGKQKERDHKNLIKQTAFQSYDNYWKQDSIRKYQKEAEMVNLEKQKAILNAGQAAVDDKFTKAYGQQYNGKTVFAVRNELSSRSNILRRKQYDGITLTPEEEAELSTISSKLADLERISGNHQITALEGVGRHYDSSLNIPIRKAAVKTNKVIEEAPVKATPPLVNTPVITTPQVSIPSVNTVSAQPFVNTILGNGFYRPAPMFKGGGKMSLDEKLTLEAVKNENRKSMEWYKNIVSLLKQEEITKQRSAQASQKAISELSKLALKT